MESRRPRAGRGGAGERVSRGRGRADFAEPHNPPPRVPAGRSPGQPRAAGCSLGREVPVPPLPEAPWPPPSGRTSHPPAHAGCPKPRGRSPVCAIQASRLPGHCPAAEPIHQSPQGLCESLSWGFVLCVGKGTGRKLLQQGRRRLPHPHSKLSQRPAPGRSVSCGEVSPN